MEEENRENRNQDEMENTDTEEDLHSEGAEETSTAEEKSGTGETSGSPDGLYDSSRLNQNHRREPINPDSTYTGNSGNSYHYGGGYPYSGSGYDGQNNATYTGPRNSGTYTGNQNDGTYAGNQNDGTYAGNQDGAYGAGQRGPGYQAGGFSGNRQSWQEQNNGNARYVRSKRVKNKPKKQKRQSSFGRKTARTVAVALIFGLVAGAAFEGVHYGASRLEGNSSSTSSTQAAGSSRDVNTQSVVNNSNSSKTVDYDVADIVAATEPSIVSITTKVTTNYQYFFQDYEQEETGAGSGIIIGKSNDVLYIATNYHVIDGAEEINVGFNDGNIVKAEVTGYDEDRDIAVVSVKFSDMEESTTKSISIATVGDSDKLQVGEPAIAIGNALGYGQSVTVGYISALNRTIEGTDGSFIQTDAAINPGNSGGALINAQGEVIGINSVKYVDSKVEGMGFSIPINDAMDIIDNIISGKKTGTTYLGISGADISKEYAQIYGFPEGIYVKEIESGSPASEAGLHQGDIIVEFDGKEVYTVESLQKLLKEKKAGDKVSLKVYRADSMGNYEETELTVTLKDKQ